MNKKVIIQDLTLELHAMGLVNLSLDDLDLIGHDSSTQGSNAGMAFAPENQWGIVTHLVHSAANP